MNLFGVRSGHDLESILDVIHTAESDLGSITSELAECLLQFEFKAR